MSTGAALTDDRERAIAEAVRERYGMQVSRVSRLGGELDWNYRARTATGESFFLRFSPQPVDPGAVSWQLAVLQELERHPLSVGFPRLVVQRDGSAHSTVRLPDAGDCLLRVTRWVPGSDVAEIGATTPLFRRQLGRLAAEVIESLSGLDGADSGRQHHWMVVRSGESIRSTMASTDRPRRDLLEQAVDWFDAAAPLIDRLPRSVVHQDLHDFNLLAERGVDGHPRLTGVVDFNDAVHTVRIAELAVTAVYATLRQRDPFAAFSDVVEGYLARASLTELELRVLYPLAVARLAVNASTWAQRAEGDNRAYAESRMAATWPSLEVLLRVSPETALERLSELQSPGAPGRAHR